jgi:hypothetical protein
MADALRAMRQPLVDYLWWTCSPGAYSHVLRMLGFEIAV